MSSVGSPSPRQSAIQLVRPTSPEEFVANTEALDQIRALGKNAKIKVVSIGGVARQGKSTLLELLSGASGAFRAADGTEPCTQGIHMLVKRKDDRSNEYLVLMDSEGTDSYARSGGYNTRLFLMCTMFSSLFVYNHRGLLSARVFDDLSVVATILEGFRAEAGAGEELAALDASLMFLLRDFDKDQLQGRPPSQYMKEWLEDMGNPENNPGVAHRNGIRAGIRKLYRKRYCLTMSLPSTSTMRVVERELAEEFKEDLEALKNFIRDEVKPFRVNNRMLNGIELADYIEKTVATVNSQTPLLQSVVQGLAWQMNKVLLSETETAYMEAMNMPPELRTMNELDKRHNNALLTAKHSLRKGMRGDQSTRAQVQVDLEKRVQQLYTAALPARKTNFNVLLKQHCVDEYKRLTGNSNLQRLASIDDLTKLHLDIYKQLRARMKHNYCGDRESKERAVAALSTQIEEIYRNRRRDLEAMLKAQGSQRSMQNGVEGTLAVGGATFGAAAVALAHPWAGLGIGCAALGVAAVFRLLVLFRTL